MMSRKDKIESGGTFTRRKFIQTIAIAGSAISAPLVLASRKSWAAAPTPGTPESDALAAFQKAADAFNKKDAYALTPLLDPNVVLRKVHINHGKPVITPRDAVMTYLEGAWHGTPPVTMIFDAFSGGQQPTVKIHGPGNSIADVTGLACWKDDDGDKADGQLDYKFELRNGSGAWLVTMLYGTYTGKPNPC